MFSPDAKLLARIAPHIQRILVADPNLASNRLLVDILKQLGARRCQHAFTTTRALEICAELQPQVIFAEFSGPHMDGVEFTWRLRRGNLPARTAPVIIISGDTRESSIRQARDAGAHEFLCKPFAAVSVYRRVENVVLKPRPWVDADAYVGPDRRRFNTAEYDGEMRREEDMAEAAAEDERTFLGADLDIRFQLELVSAAPHTAVKMMIERTFDLERMNAGAGREDLSEEIRTLQRYLVSVIDQEGLDVAVVLRHLDRIGRMRERPPRRVRRKGSRRAA